MCLDNDTTFKLYEPASVKQIIGCHFRIQNYSQAIKVYTHITSDKDIIYLFIVKYTNTTIVVGVGRATKTYPYELWVDVRATRLYAAGHLHHRSHHTGRRQIHMVVGTIESRLRVTRFSLTLTTINLPSDSRSSIDAHQRNTFMILIS